MKFETVLFAAAFLLLAIFSFPKDDQTEISDPDLEAAHYAITAAENARDPADDAETDREGATAEPAAVEDEEPR